MDFIFAHSFFLALLFVVGVCFFYLLHRKNTFTHWFNTLERRAVQCFVDRLSKIPAFIEIFRDATEHQEICNELIRLHTESLKSNVTTLYDVAFFDNAINLELGLIKRLSLHIESLKHNPDFHYVTSYLDVYNDILEAIFRDFDARVLVYERFRAFKNLTIVGFLIPMEERNPLR